MMVIGSTEVITQGMILATILAGFALAAAAQYASGDREDALDANRDRVVSVAYFFAGFVGLGAVWLGIAFFLMPTRSAEQSVVGGFFLVALITATLMAIIAFAVNLAAHANRFDYFVMIVAFTGVAVLTGAILIILAMRSIPAGP